MSSISIILCGETFFRWKKGLEALSGSIKLPYGKWLSPMTSFQRQPALAEEWKIMGVEGWKKENRGREEE